MARRRRTRPRHQDSQRSHGKRHAKAGKSQSPERPKFSSALRQEVLYHRIAAADVWELNRVASVIRKHVQWFIGDPTEHGLRAIEAESDMLRDVIDFGMVIKRLEILGEFQRSTFGVSLSAFLPELNEVYEAVRKKVFACPKSIEKAEAWLAPIACEAGADSDLEAAIYFASRGRALTEPAELREAWLRTLNLDIGRGRLVGKVPPGILARAKDLTISISEAASVLEFGGHLPRFFAFRDEEEEFIDATFFRAVEWLQVTGFDRWLRSLSDELSAGPQYGIEHSRTAFVLFYWCRSNLALQMAAKQGLDSWCWGLVNGPVVKTEPWKVHWEIPNNELLQKDYLPIASMLCFIWHRIRPHGIDSSVVSNAAKTLLEAQRLDGGWPVFSDDSKSSLLSTCLAVHGLALSKPPGWQQAANNAAKWLLAAQEDGGHWYIQGGPSVMLTVLALDSIALAVGGPTTFGIVSHKSQSRQPAQSNTYDDSKEPWRRRPLPVIKPTQLKQAAKRFRPRLGLMVATDVELDAALKLMRPTKGLSAVWQVSHGFDTFYLGRFGAFDTVLLRCSIGSQGASGSTLSTDALIQTWSPVALIMAGIAFGIDRKRHNAGDVLVAQSIIPYESQRVGREIQFRNPVPPSSYILLNRFKNVPKWRFQRPDGSLCKVHFGPILSGEKLIDSRKVKLQLVEQYPTAIGGEMEGAGLWAAASRHRTEWLVVKGVCDWADKKDDRFQGLAAAAALNLCEHVFLNPSVLDGIQR